MMRLAARFFALSLFFAPLAAAAQSTGTATTQVAVTPSASAYTAGYCVGSVQAVAGMIRPSGPGGTIVASVAIVDTTGTDAAMDLLVFTAAPTGTYVDNAACTVGSADQVRLQGLVSNTSFTCAKDSAGTTGICNASFALPLTAYSMVVGSLTPGPVNSSLIWVVAVMRATPTYGAAQKLYFNYKALPD